MLGHIDVLYLDPLRRSPQGTSRGHATGKGKELRLRPACTGDKEEFAAGGPRDHTCRKNGMQLHITLQHGLLRHHFRLYGRIGILSPADEAPFAIRILRLQLRKLRQVPLLGQL